MQDAEKLKFQLLEEEARRKEETERIRQEKLKADKQRREFRRQKEEEQLQAKEEEQQREKEMRRQEAVQRDRQKWEKEANRSKMMYSGKVGGSAIFFAIIGTLFLVSGFGMEPGSGSTVNLHQLHIKETLIYLGGVFLIMSVLSGGINKILLAFANMDTSKKDINNE